MNEQTCKELLNTINYNYMKMYKLRTESDYICGTCGEQLTYDGNKHSCQNCGEIAVEKTVTQVKINGETINVNPFVTAISASSLNEEDK